MGRINIYAETLEIDENKYRRQINKILEKEVRQAARAFLRAAIPLIPIDTGMAVGSYLHIGRFLNVAVPRGRGPYPGQMIYRHTDRREFPKSPESGADLSTSPGDAFKNDGRRFRFIFQSKVYHYILNDFGFVHGPWGSINAGREAFLNYARTTIKSKIPHLRKFIVKTARTGDGQRKVIQSTIT